MKRKHRRRILLLSFAFVIIIPFSYYLLKAKKVVEIESVYSNNSNLLIRAEENYSKEIALIAEEFDLPYEYLMALCILECSGNYPSGERFEKHVYQKLKDVQSGKRKKFENIKMKTIQDASDEALKNLATSWGPFQLMGYKCVGMDVNVMDIRGEYSTRYGAMWIKEEYGRLLKRKRYRDAFHYHNTGRKIPLNGKVRTHDPKYVDRGMEYLNYFKEKRP